QSRRLQSALRRPLHRLLEDAGRINSGYWVSRIRLCYLQGFCIYDDAEPERQNQKRSERFVQSLSQSGHGAGSEKWKPGGPWQTGCFLRRLRIPRAREVRDPGLAHSASSTRREAGFGLHRIGFKELICTNSPNSNANPKPSKSPAAFTASCPRARGLESRNF